MHYYLKVYYKIATTKIYVGELKFKKENKDSQFYFNVIKIKMVNLSIFNK